MGRPRAPARGPERAALDAAEQGRARDHRAAARMVGCSDDPARQGSRQLRGALAGDAAARDDGHAVRRRARRGLGLTGRHRPGARRGVGRAAARAGPPRARAGRVRRVARPARRRRGDCERAPGDGLLARPGRDAQRRRRQAHDLPADRPGRARTSAVGSRAAPARQAPAAAAWSGRARPRLLPGRPWACRSQPPAAPLRLAGAGGAGAGRRRPVAARAACGRMVRMSRRRRCTRGRTSGRSPTKTCCGGGLRRGCAAIVSPSTRRRRRVFPCRSTRHAPSRSCASFRS